MLPLFGIPYLKVAHTVFTIALNADIVTLDTKQISIFFVMLYFVVMYVLAFALGGARS